MFSADVERIVVDNKAVAERVKEVIKISSPRARNRVDLYENPVPLFHQANIEREIEMMYSRHVPLPSGGSLVIDSTEAVVAIDVNSGKFRDHNDAEMTAFKTDMEAADEIPRQLKLRDLGGVIICDFIDLRFERHRRELEERLFENFKNDRAKTKVLRMSQFGIIEITRQRMRPSLKRSIYYDCPHCKGAGLIKTPESLNLDVMRKLAIALDDARVVRVELSVCPDIAFYLLNTKRAALTELESRTKKKILIRTDAKLSQDELKFELFDARDFAIILEEIGMTLPERPHTTQLGNRPPGHTAQGRGGRQDQSNERSNNRSNNRKGPSRPLPARPAHDDEDDDLEEDRTHLDRGDDADQMDDGDRTEPMIDREEDPTDIPSILETEAGDEIAEEYADEEAGEGQGDDREPQQDRQPEPQRESQRESQREPQREPRQDRRPMPPQRNNQPSHNRQGGQAGNDQRPGNQPGNQQRRGGQPGNEPRQGEGQNDRQGDGQNDRQGEGQGDDENGQRRGRRRRGRRGRGRGGQGSGGQGSGQSQPNDNNAFRGEPNGNVTPAAARGPQGNFHDEDRTDAEGYPIVDEDAYGDARDDAGDDARPDTRSPDAPVKARGSDSIEPAGSDSGGEDSAGEHSDGEPSIRSDGPGLGSDQKPRRRRRRGGRRHRRRNEQGAENGAPFTGNTNAPAPGNASGSDETGSDIDDEDESANEAEPAHESASADADESSDIESGELTGEILEIMDAPQEVDEPEPSTDSEETAETSVEEDAEVEAKPKKRTSRAKGVKAPKAVKTPRAKATTKRIPPKKSRSAKESAAEKAAPAVEAPAPVVRKGSADKHLISDEPVIPQPLSPPQKLQRPGRDPG